MPEHRWRSDPLPTASLTRAVGAVGLATVAVIHVVDLPNTWTEAPLIGYGYVALIGSALLAAILLVGVPDRRVWLLVDLVAFTALAGYVLSRTTGLPTDSFDVGHWDCPLGTTAISTETLLVLVALWQALVPGHPRPEARIEHEPYDALSGST